MITTAAAWKKKTPTAAQILKITAKTPKRTHTAALQALNGAQEKVTAEIQLSAAPLDKTTALFLMTFALTAAAQKEKPAAHLMFLLKMPTDVSLTPLTAVLNLNKDANLMDLATSTAALTKKKTQKTQFSHGANTPKSALNTAVMNPTVSSGVKSTWNAESFATAALKEPQLASVTQTL